MIAHLRHCLVRMSVDKNPIVRQRRNMAEDLAEKLILLIRSDQRMMTCLAAVRALDLPACWITAGFVRNHVWDHLHGHAAPTPLNDIDVIYFDPDHLDTDIEKHSETALSAHMPGLPWEVRNQVRMAEKNGDPPYSSINDALEHWCETPTAIGVRLDWGDRVLITAPLGLTDLFEMIARPTPFAMANPQKLARYRERMIKKNWPRLWPKVKVLNL